MKRIDADVLIPGRGAPVTDGTVLLEDGRISYAGPTAEAPPTPGDVPVTRAAAVMPGLWDCHTHLMGLSPARGFDLQNVATEPVAGRAARTVRDLRAALDAGVTSVREVGGLGVDLAPVVAEGTIDGPAIYGAGAVLSTTGGHGDVHALPLPWMHDLSRRQSDFRLCDGVDDCIRATREQLRRNARIIKVCCSGGVISERDHPEHQQFSATELRAIVETAALAGRVVAGHCHGKSGIIQALEAGVRTIEHGTYLDEETCAAMRETGAILVPTRLIMAELSKQSDTMPPWVAGKLAPMVDRHAEAVAMAHSRGVTLALGTDISSSSPAQPMAWGTHGRELVLLTSLGLTPLEAIEAATANAPLTLGDQAPRSGLLAAGFDADVITLAENPLADIRVFADPSRVTGVWQGGRRVKG